MRMRPSNPSAQHAVPQTPQHWALLSVLLYMVSMSLLVVQVLAHLRREGKRRTGTNTGEESPRSTPDPASDRRGGGRLRPQEEAAFKAGVDTTFDVIAVLRDLVGEALSAQDEGSVSSPNGRARGPSPPEARRP